MLGLEDLDDALDDVVWAFVAAFHATLELGHEAVVRVRVLEHCQADAGAKIG